MGYEVVMVNVIDVAFASNAVLNVFSIESVKVTLFTRMFPPNPCTLAFNVKCRLAGTSLLT